LSISRVHALRPSGAGGATFTSLVSARMVVAGPNLLTFWRGALLVRGKGIAAALKLAGNRGFTAWLIRVGMVPWPGGLVHRGRDES